MFGLVGSKHEAELRVFVELNYAKLSKAAYFLTGDWQLAQDVTQAVMLDVIRKWDRIRTVEFPAAYVQAMLVRQASSHRRMPWRRSETTVADPPEHPAASDIEGFEASESLQRHLSSLPQKQREVLVLRYYLGLSEAEIAHALKCSVGTVKSRASRGLEALRNQPGLRDLVGH